jgi:hypothetical protein
MGGAALDHIQEPVAVQVHEAGDQQRGVLGAGGEERVLIYPERRGGAEPGQMVDPRVAVVAHRGHGGMPANSEAACHLRDGAPRLAHEPADLCSGPLRQRRPRRDVVDLLGPRAHRAIRLGATPPPLGPHQHHRPIGHRQIPHLHPPAAVAHRPAATAVAAHHVGRRLHHQPQLPDHRQLGADHELRHPQQHGRCGGSVAGTRRRRTGRRPAPAWATVGR